MIVIGIDPVRFRRTLQFGQAARIGDRRGVARTDNLSTRDTAAFSWPMARVAIDLEIAAVFLALNDTLADALRIVRSNCRPGGRSCRLSWTDSRDFVGVELRCCSWAWQFEAQPRNFPHGRAGVETIAWAPNRCHRWCAGRASERPPCWRVPPRPAPGTERTLYGNSNGSARLAAD